MNSTLKRLICLLLCLCMTMGTMLLLSSCGGDDGEGDPTENAGADNGEELNDGKVTVIRALTLLEKGRKLIRTNFEEVRVDPSVVPEGAITDIKKAINMYTDTVLYPGDYVFADKLSAEKDKSAETGADKFIVVTEHMKSKTDASKDVQALIDANPNSTLYFPDGTYMLANPIKVPTEAGKAVSIRMSYRAVIQPNATWAHDDTTPLIHVGSDKEKPAGTKGEDACSITGGIIDTSGKSTGILVEGAGNVYIANMAVKRIESVGIHIKTDNVDVDNVVGTGTESSDHTKCIGVLVEGSYNTVSNMRIYKINTGIKLTKGNNVLRNLHPLLSPSQCTAKNAEETYGFYDTSEGNYYDYCYSDQLAIGFYLGNGNASIINGCFVYWYTDALTRHWGLYAEGSFDAIVRASRFDNTDHNTDSINPDNAYIVSDTGTGKGMILDPIASGHNPYGSNYRTFNGMYDANDSLKNCKLSKFRKK